MRLINFHDFVLLYLKLLMAVRATWSATLGMPITLTPPDLNSESLLPQWGGK